MKYYLKQTGDCMKLTGSAGADSVRDGALSKRDSSNGKSAKNLRRAKNEFLDIARANRWEWFATFTSANPDPEKDIRGMSKWLNNWNTNHHAKIKYQFVFEFGETGGRLHCHMLLKDVPPEFCRYYTKSEYSGLPAELKKAYSKYKTPDGTRLATCPWWKKGFSTLVPCDGSSKVASYMAKYMTKENMALTARFGGHCYFCSKGLDRPEKHQISDDLASTIVQNVPDAWHAESEFSCTTYIDKDKVPAKIWNALVLLLDDERKHGALNPALIGIDRYNNDLWIKGGTSF